LREQASQGLIGASPLIYVMLGLDDLHCMHAEDGLQKIVGLRGEKLAEVRQYRNACIEREIEPVLSELEKPQTNLLVRRIERLA
jgi:hypothetical protein